MRILLTNDDGIEALGIRALHKSLTGSGHEVFCVAPVSEMSAVSHALTMNTPLRVHEIHKHDFTGYAVTGTPVDCVKLAIKNLMPAQPDLVISGINAGANVGVDILYSGTVSAAREATLMGFPALAVSYDNFAPQELSEQALYVSGFLKQRPWTKLSNSHILNLNFPDCLMSETKGLRLAFPAQTLYEDGYEKRIDPRGRSYYWLAGDFPHEKLEAETDRDLLNNNFITLTPIHLELTSMKTLDQLRYLESISN